MIYLFGCIFFYFVDSINVVFFVVWGINFKFGSIIFIGGGVRYLY